MKKHSFNIIMKNEKNKIRKSAYVKRTPEQWEVIRQKRIQSKLEEKNLRLQEEYQERENAFQEAIADFDGKWVVMPENPHYRVLDNGKVWSFRRMKFLTPTNQSVGYNFIGTFVYDGKKQLCLLHRVIAKAFIPNPDNKPHIQHINNIKTDNRASNLLWVTQLENIQYAVKDGLVPNGENSGRSKLNNTAISDIRTSKLSAKKLAAKYNVSIKCIYNVKWNNTWKGVAA